MLFDVLLYTLSIDHFLIVSGKIILNIIKSEVETDLAEKVGIKV